MLVTQPSERCRYDRHPTTPNKPRPVTKRTRFCLGIETAELARPSRFVD